MVDSALSYPAVAAVTAQPKPAKVSFKLLLGLYLIIPLCFVGYLLDFTFLNSYLRKTLPRAPESYLVFSLLFGSPHIVASNIIYFTNQEYFRTYWLRVALVTVGIILFFGLGGALLSDNLIFAIVATATVIHVVKQQIGIGNITSKLAGGVYQVWMWTMVGSSVLMYNVIFLQPAFTRGQVRMINVALIVSAFVIAGAAFILQFKVPTVLGKRFLWANTVLILMSFFLYSQKYYFFAVLGPRIVHDVTAFIFYMVHDYNRHHDRPQNTLYKILQKVKLNAFIAVPALAFLVTLFLQKYADPIFAMLTHAVLDRTFPRAIAIGFVGYLGLMHYYMEPFTWKGGSPYRKYIGYSMN